MSYPLAVMITAFVLTPMLCFGVNKSSGRLSETAAEVAKREEWQTRTTALKTERQTEAAERSITSGTHTLRWQERIYGEPGKQGWPLWISLHGGGEVPGSINDAQWEKQVDLYKPAQGIYLAPRAPTDTWFMWNESHVDPLLERLIETMIAVRGADPNRIYLVGYSAGGNGVYHLAARMGDRFAAAAAMAGYPSGAPIVNLRNLPFAILVGNHDITFDRVKEAESWKSQLLVLRSKDPRGYRHLVKIYPDYGHWMEGRDAEALPWMAQFTRQPWPKKIVCVQDEVPHARFHWLEVSAEDAKPGRELRAEVVGQTIRIEGPSPASLKLWLSDALVDLDQPVRVILNRRLIYHHKVPRSRAAIRASLAARLDLPACATALLELTPRDSRHNTSSR
jgi:predicted esterase